MLSLWLFFHKAIIPIMSPKEDWRPRWLTDGGFGRNSKV